MNKHCWFSGRILACHAGDRGSIPRQCICHFVTISEINPISKLIINKSNLK